MPQDKNPSQPARLVSQYGDDTERSYGGGCDTIHPVLGNVVMNTYHTSYNVYINLCFPRPLFLIREQHTMVAKTVRKYIAPKYPVIDPFTVLYSPDEALVLPQLKAI
jgi:hypothetical protein